MFSLAVTVACPPAPVVCPEFFPIVRLTSLCSLDCQDFFPVFRVACVSLSNPSCYVSSFDIVLVNTRLTAKVPFLVGVGDSASRRAIKAFDAASKDHFHAALSAVELEAGSALVLRQLGRRVFMRPVALACCALACACVALIGVAVFAWPASEVKGQALLKGLLARQDFQAN